MIEHELREAIVACGRMLVETGLVQGTWGNIAVRLDERHMLVTPSGLDYLALTADDIVKMDLQTLAYSSKRKPTSEKRLHQAVLRARPDVGAVIHTHSPDCSVLAAAGATLPAMTEEMRSLVGGGARTAAHALPSTGKLSRVALAALEGRNACLLTNHGVLCCGRDLEEAYRVCEVMEAAAGRLIAEHSGTAR